MKLYYFSWLPGFILMVIIFAFSSQEATTSDENSLPIAQVAYEIYEELSNQEIENNKEQEIINVINTFVRKSAHFIEYALLSFLIAFHIWACNKKVNVIFFVAIVISFLYASSDEFHQLFVDGRSGQFKDVLIDTSGAVVGSFIFTRLITILNHLRYKFIGDITN
jgi:VanZ family protein